MFFIFQKNDPNDPFEEQISDITLGLMDGLTVPISVATGLVASGQSRQIIITAIIAEAIAGSISMGLSDYISVDSIKERKDTALKSGIRTSIGYLFGSFIPLLSYLLTNDVQTGFKLSITINFLCLVLFGYVRSVLLKEDIQNSIRKVLLVGISAMILTYLIVGLIRPKCKQCE